MEEFIDKTAPLDTTINVKKVLGARVISNKNFSIGKVAEVRIKQDTKTLEGIVVKRGLLGLFAKPIYIGKNYFNKLTPEAVILNIEPTILLKNKKVVTYEGEIIGKVKDIIRQDKTNIMKGVVVKSFLRGIFTVPTDQIKSTSNSIILKDSYNAPKKSLWRRNR